MLLLFLIKFSTTIRILVDSSNVINFIIYSLIKFSFRIVFALLHWIWIFRLKWRFLQILTSFVVHTSWKIKTFASLSASTGIILISSLDITFRWFFATLSNRIDWLNTFFLLLSREVFLLDVSKAIVYRCDFRLSSLFSIFLNKFCLILVLIITTFSFWIFFN